MDRLQEIIRFLTAAGGTPSRDGNSTHFTYEDEGSIRMRTWTRSELIDDELVADGVRPGTSAPIVNRSHKRVFVVDKDDSIKCFTDLLGDNDQVDEIDDDAPWNEEEIADVDTRVHTQSQLAVSYDKNTVFVFYQKPDGTLGCINEYNNQWKDVKLPATAALAGTPLATCNTNYAVFLFYISTDGTVRYLENREGRWNDMFFSAAKIIDPKAKLPGSAFTLTVAEDRQPFERIRPMIFCLDNKDLSIIRFRSKKLDTIGRVEGTEFVPSFNNRDRNKYYFWSPYPFYTMIKRRGKTLAQATTSKGLWTQCVKRPYPQQDLGNSSAMEHLDNSHSAPMVNKTPPTVSVETTNAQAIIPPQTSEQRETPNGSSARSSIFVGFGGIAQPLNAIRRRFFGTRQNEDVTEEDTPEDIESNHADIVDILPQENESETNQMEGGVIESNDAETSISETKETGLKETEHEKPKNDEDNILEPEAKEASIKEYQPENQLEVADSEGTEETGSERTDSEAADTAPSEIEFEVEDNQYRKIQAEETQIEKIEGEEVESDEFEGEESEDEESEDGNPEDGEVQLSQGRTRGIQAEEAQTKNPLTGDAPTNNSKAEEYEAKVSENGRVEAEKHESKHVTRPESEPASAKAKEPTTKPSTTQFTEGSLTIKPSSDLEHPDPEATKHTGIPAVSEAKDLATTDAPILNEPRHHTPREIEEGIIGCNKNVNRDTYFPNESPYIPGLADNEFELKKSKENLLDRGADTPDIAKHYNAQMKNIQTQEDCDDIQDQRVPTEEPQTKEAGAKEAELKESGSEAESEELESKRVEINGFAPKEPESKSVKWAETEAKVAAEASAARAPIAMTRASKSPTTRRSRMNPKVETAVAGGSGKVSDTEESGSGGSDSEDSDCETSTHHKENDTGNPDASVPTRSRFTTQEEIRADIANFIDESDLSSFFPDGSPYLDTVVENAAKLKKKKKNKAKNDAHMQSIARLNIYQPVLYCDDSTSMNVGKRVGHQKKMVRRVTQFSTCLAPLGYGTSLQFINLDSEDVHNDKLSYDDVKKKIDSMHPRGKTKIGTNLKRKILKPLIYDVINSKKRLKRPIFITCITDGCPSGESTEQFKEEILKCVRFLDANGYPRSTVRFQISQIGNDLRADRFLEELKGEIRCDPDLKEVLYCTAERLDEKFDELKKNEEMLEQWLLRTLVTPLMGERISTLDFKSY